MTIRHNEYVDIVILAAHDIQGFFLLQNSDQFPTCFLHSTYIITCGANAMDDASIFLWTSK